MNLLCGELVQLAAVDSNVLAEAWARWSQDTEYSRFRFPMPAQPATASSIRNGWGDVDDIPPDRFHFAFYTLAEHRLIGDGGLFDVDWVNGDAEVGLGIGEREYWSRGYGTDAIRLLLRYSFTELNLHRVTLTVLAANPRARRSYEKVGFVLEGLQRKQSQYAGQRVDEVYMGILRSEWERAGG